MLGKINLNSRYTPRFLHLTGVLLSPLLINGFQISVGSRCCRSVSDICVIVKNTNSISILSPDKANCSCLVQYLSIKQNKFSINLVLLRILVNATFRLFKLYIYLFYVYICTMLPFPFPCSIFQAKVKIKVDSP